MVAMKMGASRSHNMQLCPLKLFFTPISKVIVSYLAAFFNRFQHMLNLDPTRKILIHHSRQVGGGGGSDGVQNPMSTQGKGILMPGVDRCIVKDRKCPIIAEFGKKTCTNCRWSITCESLPCHFITF